MKDILLARLTPYGQEHLLAFWDSLDAQQRVDLAVQIDAIDFEQLRRLYEGRGAPHEVCGLVERARSPRGFRLDCPRNPFSPEEAAARGAEALAAGRVGVVLVAGGQATRLGVDFPKGMYSIGPVSGKSLLQIHVEKILAASRRSGRPIPLYLMTSPATDEPTRAFLDQNACFGLPAEDLHIFCQGAMPAVDARTGKVLLASPHAIASSPDGHGGMLAALARSGGLADCRRRRIEQLFYFQVDNPLVDVCGRTFLGYHLLSGSELSSQVVAKRDSLDRVGNVIDVDGRLQVIEYSDLPDEVARLRNTDGSLRIWAGSIAVHALDVAFLERMVGRGDVLPFHLAVKRVPHVDASGRLVESMEPNAIKFERFIFDLIPHAAGAVVVEVDPVHHFAPLKHAPGQANDTAEKVQAQMIAEHASWLRRSGVEVAEGVPVEISPLVALEADDLAGKVRPGTRITEPTYLD